MSRPKKYTIWIIILLAIGAGVYYFFQSGKPKTSYVTERATRGSLAQTVSATGTLKAENRADLAFQGSGRLTEMLFEVGDSVKKGEKMAETDKGALYIQLNQARHDLEAQEQTLSHMKDNRDTYSKDQRDAQRAVIERYKEAVNLVLRQIYETRLYAPISGTVIRKNFNVGENVAPNQAVYEIAGVGGMEIEADVPESDIVKIMTGQRAIAAFDAFSAGEEFAAEVTKIDPASTATLDVVYYKVRLKLKDEDARLKIGMTADIDIRTAEKDGIVSVPLRAVKEEGDRKYVEIVKTAGEDQMTEKIYVETGLRGDDGLVEITSGLSGGEEVVTLIRNGE